MTIATDVDVLAARGTAYALLGHLLSIDTTALADPAVLDELRSALAQAGAERAATAVARATVATDDPADLRRRWVRWFDQGRVAPYECSNTPPSAGGHTPRLADVAGFYRAFGQRVAGDRPDHVVAELEFASLVCLAEANARTAGEVEAAEVCADAARSFLRDHLGRWLDAWAARVRAVEALTPWWPYATAAALLVADDAAHRNVVPVLCYPVLPDDASLLPDEEPLPVCGSETVDWE